MTKSVQARLVLIMVLLIVATMIVVGTVLVNRVSVFYDEDFENQITTFFDDDVKAELQDAADSDDAVAQLLDILEAYSGALGIDSYRSFYILDGNGSFLGGPNAALGASLEKSDNILRAMAGQTGDETGFTSDYMDFALPVFAGGGQEVSYIVYVKDTKEEMRDLNWVLISIVVETLFLGMLIAVVLSFLLARTITNPIENITRGASKIAAGDLSVRLKTRSKDEIGVLSSTFNNMADTLAASLEDIKGERNKLQTIFLYLTDGVAAFDENGLLLSQNRAAREMLGGDFTEEQTTYGQMFEKAGIENTFEEAKNLPKRKYLISEQKVGGRVLRFHIAPFGADEQEGGAMSGGVIVVMNDITEQQRLEQSRREFIANVSHELRTPLTNIKSYSETVIDDKEISRETTERFLKIAVGETDRMIRIVKDLMVLSRLDSNKAEFSFERFSVPELIDTVYQAMLIEAEKHNQELTVNVDEKVGEIAGDRQKIEQVLVNIVSNAIKYTLDGGKISIDAAVHRGNVYIKVADNGLGIPKKDLPRVFERFYRVDKARSREMGGTGLGLAIAKEIVEAHNGKIAITSKVDEGTEVIVQLPVMNEKGK